MKQIIFKSKWITFEIYRRSFVFSIGTVLLASGVSLCNENVLISIISIFSKQHYNVQTNNFGLIIGLFLVLLSLFVFYLLIINWRKEIYSEVFIQIRNSYDTYGTALQSLIRYANVERLKSLKQEAQDEYEKAQKFLYDNQILVDAETFTAGCKILQSIGEEIIHFDSIIKHLELPNSDPYIRFDAKQAIRETNEEVGKINELVKEFVLLIKEKEKYRLKL